MTSFDKFFMWDAFISHASEDKDDFVRPLADGLKERGLTVWFDEFELKVGDSLRESIDRGLERSRFGIVVISPHFFKKQWPKNELNGLTTRETGGTKVILPVWYNIDAEAVRTFSLVLADRFCHLFEQGSGAGHRGSRAGDRSASQSSWVRPLRLVRAPLLLSELPHFLKPYRRLLIASARKSRAWPSPGKSGLLLTTRGLRYFWIIRRIQIRAVV